MKIGVLGTGQLGRMLAHAAPEGVEMAFYGNGDAGPVRGLGPVCAAAYDDRDALIDFTEGLDALTYEFENVAADHLHEMAERVRLSPPVRALEVSQDRLVEKTFFNELGLETAPFRAVDSHDGLVAAVDALGAPARLKTRRFGYDGKGQFPLQSADDIPLAWETLGGPPLILEGFVDFDAEYSIIGARDLNGRCAFYPLVQSHHRSGILRVSVSPIAVDRALVTEAQRISRAVMDTLDYVGVLTIEMFASGDRLLINEMAPRVHNSGHWTIEGTTVSQFRNHMLCVSGKDVELPQPRGYSMMINVIGDYPSDADAARGAVHDYQKSAARPGRKMGHVTAVHEAMADRDRHAAAVLANLDDVPPGTLP
ncbi:MAG: 5-(carboxyamino)imidazole ribonucleotide synthase [Myxococcota bacterium]